MVSILVSYLAILASTFTLLSWILPQDLLLKLLRITPLISSTANLMWAADEYMFLSSWLSPAYRVQANALLPAWFATWGKKGSHVLFSSFPLSLVAGILNIFTSEDVTGKMWYGAGVAFTFAHFLYGKKALRLLAAIRNGEPKGNATESMREWIEMHLFRVVTADAPAFVSFAGALLMAIPEVS
ncbi:hypothetical protein VF21_09483 [Pseudogymnoascus sp. 05NY08]|nr:hypothetical protein VF21_09483 [Pseudogymnoascus sp. 05NY08]